MPRHGERQFTKQVDCSCVVVLGSGHMSCCKLLQPLNIFSGQLIAKACYACEQLYTHARSRGLVYKRFS
jgi:hypothetical protein